MTQESQIGSRANQLEELLLQEDPPFVREKDQCHSWGFLKGLGVMFTVATGIGLHHNYKELTTRVRIKHIYFLPLTVGGLASFLYTRHNYLSCKEKFMKDLEQYHKARNFTPYPDFRQGEENSSWK